MTKLVVTAPYVTIKCRTDAGVVLREFYAGAPVPDGADKDNVARLLRKGMLAEPEAGAAAEEAPPGVDPALAESPTPQGEADEDKAEHANGDARRPHGNASHATWLDYAVSKRAEGVSEEDARASLEDKTKAELVAEYGG